MIRKIFLGLATVLWAAVLLFPLQRLQPLRWSFLSFSVPIYYFLITLPTLGITLYALTAHRPHTVWQWIWWLFPLICLPGICMGLNPLWSLRQWASLWIRGLALSASLTCLIHTTWMAQRCLEWIYVASVAACLLGVVELTFNINPLTDTYIEHPVSVLGPIETE